MKKVENKKKTAKRMREPKNQEKDMKRKRKKINEQYIILTK